MATEPVLPDETARLALKVIRVRRLTDPLGAAGFRRTDWRVEREARARRAAFVASLTSFVALLALIAVPFRGMPGDAEAEPSRAPALVAGLTSNRVVPDRPVKRVRIVEDGKRSHVRTRSTP